MKGRLLLSALSAVCATLFFSTGASAADQGRHHMSSRLAAQKSGGANLFSHGGKVETAPAVYISYWGPEWGVGFSTGGYPSSQAQSYVNGFYANVGGSSWINSTTQYCQGVPRGTYSCPVGAAHVVNLAGQLKGAWNDSTPVPRSPATGDIAAAAQRAVARFGYDANGTYMVFTPTGKSTSGFGSQYCAWHSETSVSSGPVAYANIPYQPDAGAGCGMNFVNGGNNAFGNGYFDGFSIVGGHEYAEAITNPRTNTSPGWLDRSGAENGDKCAWSAASANISLGGQSYAVQPLWSNAANGGRGGCVIAYP